MLDENCVDQLRSLRIDALTAKHLHHGRLSRKRKASLVVDFLAIGVPVLYFALRFTAKGTQHQEVAEIAWEFLAAILLALAIIKMSFRWEDYIGKHSELMAENNWFASKANKMADAAPSTPRKEFDQLREQAVELEDKDLRSLGTVPDQEKRRAYREALKESSPNGVCPICQSSAYSYTPGSCQVCGNTPSSGEKHAKGGLPNE